MKLEHCNYVWRRGDTATQCPLYSDSLPWFVPFRRLPEPIGHFALFRTTTFSRLKKYHHEKMTNNSKIKDWLKKEYSIEMRFEL